MPGMLERWQGGVAALLATALAVVLVVLDVTDSHVRRWWDVHALTTDAVAGVLVLLITVLVADQVVRARQLKGRAQATAAQAALLVAQADRSVQSVSNVLVLGSDKESAGEEVRTYMAMLLLAGPVLIDADKPRRFLECAQQLGGELALALGHIGDGPRSDTKARIDAALEEVRSASKPLLRHLNFEQRLAIVD